VSTSVEQPNRATLTRPLIAASATGFRGARRLPQVADDEAIGLHLSYNTYEKISCDPEASAALLLLIYFVLSDGVQFSPAIAAPAEGKTDPRYDRAVEIRDHVDRTFANLSRTLPETLEMLIRPAMEFGHKVAEKVYDIPTDGPDAYKLVLKRVAVLERGSTAFVVDEYRNLIGLVPARAYTADYLRGNRIELDNVSNVIDPEKFVIATFRMQDEDPRGRSIYRSVVRPWHVKQLAWPEFLTFLMRCAIPGLISILSPNAGDDVLRDDDGNIVLVNGKPVSIAVKDMLSALLDFKNSTALVVENGTDVKALEVKSKGEPFNFAFTICNKEIRKGILLQELATADAEHQTKGSTASQMGIVDLLVWSIKQWVSESIVRRQMVQPQVRYNFGEEDARELTPMVALGDYERKDWAEDSAAVVALVGATVIDEMGTRISALSYSQIQSLLSQIGLPAPTEEEVAAMRAGAEERRKQQEAQMKQAQGNGAQRRAA
jgi:hypothetical protein